MSTMTASDIQKKVSRILSGTMNLNVPGPEADLVASGQLDSLALVDLLMHLEQSFGIAVSLEGLEIDELRSVTRISGLVAKRLAAA
jgi:methoxymalonate biosynthesis acyl carrier protein